MTYTPVRWTHGLLKEGAAVFLVTEEDTPLAVSQCLCGTEESKTGTSAVLCCRLPKTGSARAQPPPGARPGHRNTPDRHRPQKKVAFLCWATPACFSRDNFTLALSLSPRLLLLLVCYLAKCLNLLLLITR
jgi:hypothetical protein